MTDSSSLFVRQLLSGRDYAREDPIAQQMANFVYLIGDSSTREVLLVDPAYAPLELVRLLAEDDLQPIGVVLTHFHADHAGGDLFGTSIAGVAELLGAVDLPIHVQQAELEWLALSTGLGRDSFVGHEDGTRIDVGGVACELMHTPGHTPGSQCLLTRGHLITGDTLFIEGCGRTDFPGGDPGALFESISRLGRLADDTLVLPGHHYSAIPRANLGDLKRVNPVLLPYARERWLSAFAG